MSKPKKSTKDAPSPLPVVTRPRVPVALLVRMFVIGAISVGAAGYAVYRYWFVPRTPMVVPAEPAAGSPTEIPAPELEPVPSGSGG